MTFLTIEVRTKHVDVDGAVDRVIDAVMHDVVDKARSSMERSKHGRTYVRHGIRHRASAPGEAPGIQPPGFADTAGELYASIVAFPTADGAVIQASTDYAGFLEYGTRKMEPRPFLTPAYLYAVRRKPRYEMMFKRMVET